jgi:hypothetical protein
MLDKVVGNGGGDGGGGAAAGVPIFDASIGASGADFATAAEAITAGKRTLKVVSNVAEIGDVDIPAGNFYVYIPYGLTWDLGAFKFTASSLTRFEVNGTGGTLKFTHTVTPSQPLFQDAWPANSIHVLRNIIVENASTAASSGWFHPSSTTSYTLIVENVIAKLANTAAGGIQIWSNSAKVTIRGLELIGGGSSCAQGLDLESVFQCDISDILFSGTWSSSNRGIFTSANTTVTAEGIKTSVTGTNIILEFNGNRDTITNVSCSSTAEFTIQLNGANTLLSNIRLAEQTGGSLAIVASDCYLSNVRGIDTFSITGTSRGNIFKNCRFNTAVSLNGDENKYTNCHFVAGATVPSGANDNGFVNSQFGPLNGGGASTITIAASAFRTRIVGCMTDAAISDSGTGTATAANTVY